MDRRFCNLRKRYHDESVTVQQGLQGRRVSKNGSHPTNIDEFGVFFFVFRAEKAHVGVFTIKFEANFAGLEDAEDIFQSLEESRNNVSLVHAERG